jgi:hypothetical protein
MMSRTYRKQPTYIFRAPKTFNELRANCDDYNDTEYTVSKRNRYIPTLYDDISISAYQQLDHHHQ